MENGLNKKYGLLTAICMVVGIVVGSGVFFKAQTILQKTNGDMPLGIAAWAIGGLIMIVCILAFANMAQKYEKVNGVVDYAEALVGPKYGYYMGWFMTTIYYPSMTSVLAWLSARYTLVFINSVNPDFTMIIPASEGGCIIGQECMALTMFFLLCLCHQRPVPQGGRQDPDHHHRHQAHPAGPDGSRRHHLRPDERHDRCKLYDDGKCRRCRLQQPPAGRCLRHFLRL